jgi:hypothetical protein
MATQINLDIAQRVDITCRRGDTFVLELTFKDEDGVAIDISSGYSWKMQVKDSDTSDVALLNGNSIDDNANDFAFSGDNNGVLTITATASVMATISGGSYVYDLQSSQGAVVTTWMFGKFTVNEDVSA